MDRPQNARQQNVSALQTDDYVCISPDTPLLQAIEALKTDEGGCVIVCTGRRVVGIFTARDLLMRVLGEPVDLNSPISEGMSPAVVSLAPEATIGGALSVMDEKGFRNLPLVRDHHVVGA